MKNTLKLQHSQDQKLNKSDFEWIEDFFEMLKGKQPEGVSFGHGHKPKMSAKKAMTIIWYLQEVLSVFPDNIDMCCNCEGLYDANSSGYYDDKKFKHYCDSCEHLAPHSEEN